MYELFCNGIVCALGRMGILSAHKLPNDVLVSGRKISGSAQCRRSGCTLIHGSLIVKLDPVIERMIIRKREAAYDGLTSMEDSLGHVPERDVIVRSIIEGLSNSFESAIEPDSGIKEILCKSIRA